MTKIESLKVLADEVASCVACDLHKSRNKSVFSKGSPDAKIVFLGEGPGKDENESGIPFCGRSGKLLDVMIKAMGLNPEDVYITNAVKCRPPENRKPISQEISCCNHFLIDQLDLIAPKVIIALGASATEALLGPGEGISKRRGKWEIYNGIKVLPTFHPAAMLYNPKLKEIVAEDLKKVLLYLKDN